MTTSQQSEPRVMKRLRQRGRMGIGFSLGKFDVEAGGMLVKKGRLWIPDGFHLWWGDRGLHAFWSSSLYARRVTFDRKVSASDVEIKHVLGHDASGGAER